MKQDDEQDWTRLEVIDARLVVSGELTLRQIEDAMKFVFEDGFISATDIGAVYHDTRRIRPG